MPSELYIILVAFERLIDTMLTNLTWKIYLYNVTIYGKIFEKEIKR